MQSVHPFLLNSKSTSIIAIEYAHWISTKLILNILNLSIVPTLTA